MRLATLAILMSLPVVFHATRVTASPDLGDTAPELRISGWLGEKPPSVPGDENAKDHVFVVAMWASWHNRSLALIPMLHQLQTENADKGLLVIAVSNEEADEIAPHIKSELAKPAYFALETDAYATDTWADDVDIPIVYVISQKNVIAWKGDPNRRPGEIDQVIRKLNDGTFDLEAARNAEDNEQKYRELQAKLQTAYAMGKQDEAFTIVDQMIATKPTELHPYFIKRQMIQQFQAFFRLPAHLSAIERAFKDSASDLARIIEVELTFDVGDRNPGFMIRCADRLSALTRDRDPAALVTIATVNAELGLHADAISMLERAIVLLPPGDGRSPIEMRLAYYQAIVRMREQRKKKPKASIETPPADVSKSD